MPLPRPSPQPRLWFRIVVFVVVGVGVFIAAAGFFYENILESRDRRFHPMPGELVDVGSYKMHIDCMGQGTPTVIFDSGLGDAYISWRKVQPSVAQFTKACSYDRAGLGYSDASPLPRTSKNIAEELHTLLYKAGIAGPFVLVGHSMGGFDVRLYASLFRGEVVGMVLVDSSHPDQKKRLPPAVVDMERSWLRQAEFLEFTMPYGIPRLLGFCGRNPSMRAAKCNFRNARTNVGEIRAFSQSAAQTAATGSLGDLPLAVLSHDPEKVEPELPEDLVKPTNDIWQQMQQDLAQLSTRSTHVVAKGSSHYIQIDRPEIVVEAVRRVVEEARSLQSSSQPKP
jgi:pimeloyl-ACP methyl ester carboxylesterase